MRKIQVLSMVVAGLLIAGCTCGPKPLTDERKAGIGKEVRAVWDQTAAAVEKSDAAGYLAVFSPDGFLGMNSQGVRFGALQAYADTVKFWFGMRTGNKMQDEKVTLSVLCEDAVMLDQTCIFEATFTNGTLMRVQHAGSFLFRKEAAGWKIVHGHESWLPL